MIHFAPKATKGENQKQEQEPKMPNQRKKGKAMIGGYVPKELADAFKAEAQARGLTAKELLEILVRQEVRKDKGNEQ